MWLPDSVRVVTRPDTVTAASLVEAGRAERAGPAGDRGAVPRFREAIVRDRGALDAYWELGWSYASLERWSAAADIWRALRVRAPQYPGLQRYLPIVEMRRDRELARARRPDDTPLPIEVTPREGERLSWAAVGDVQFGMGWPPDRVNLPPDSGRALFAGVRDALEAADVTFGNLETALADAGDSEKCRRGSRNCYAFRAPTAYARTLRETGFDVVSANNNHAGDFGKPGRSSTVAALDAVNVANSGPASGVASWETNGLRIALIAFATGEGPFRIQDLDEAGRIVARADRDHDLVVVSFHGGAEGADKQHVPRRVEYAYGEDRGDVYAFAHAVVDAGADLVLGHGPHVLRGMEVYRGRLIAYSLGNFSSWGGFNLRGPLGISVILHVDLAPNGVVTDALLDPVVLERPGVPTPDPSRRGIEIVRALSRDDFGEPLFDPGGRMVPRPRTQ